MYKLIKKKTLKPATINKSKRQQMMYKLKIVFCRFKRVQGGYTI